MVTILTGRTLLTFGGADGRLPLEHLPQLLQADLRQGSSGTLADADLLLRILSATPALIETMIIVAATVFLLRALRRIASSEPFHPMVLRHWKLLASILIGGGILQGLADTAAGAYLFTHISVTAQFDPAQRNEFLGGDYVAIGTNLPQWPVTTIVAGFVALALMTAFRSGAKLERDVDGVV
ncbi:hypothetical protein [Marisediminicola sp. LYQ85]|uniref:hypothetical protein n=1 Tax=Marisediminicola sp. LYQ85 TaxID=3391062 RepID=UPI003983A4D1